MLPNKFRKCECVHVIPVFVAGEGFGFVKKPGPKLYLSAETGGALEVEALGGGAGLGLENTPCGSKGSSIYKSVRCEKPKRRSVRVMCEVCTSGDARQRNKTATCSKYMYNTQMQLSLTTSTRTSATHIAPEITCCKLTKGLKIQKLRLLR